MLIPEFYTPASIALVWPEHLPSEVGSRLKGFYREFIRILLKEDIKILLLYCEQNDLQKLKNLFGQENITFHFEPDVSDIWIRDFGPFFSIEDSKIKPVKTLYQPSYGYSTKENEWFVKNNKVGFDLIKPVPEKVELNGNELILDGGNFIHNRFGTAIVTNRIVTDNEHLFVDEIREILEEKHAIHELFIIPSEPGDDTGHIDGLVRFLDPNTVAVLHYPDKYNQNEFNIKEEEYYESVKVTNKISEYLKKNNFNVIRIPNSIPQKGIYKIPCKCMGNRTFENATGNYMNFLRAGDKIFIPQYNNPDDDERAYQAFLDYFEKIHPEIKVIKVSINATALAQYGGVLNCITLQIYNEKIIYYELLDKFFPVAYEEKGRNNVSVIYFALKDKVQQGAHNYDKLTVVQADLYNKSVSSPKILEHFYANRNLVPLDPVEDDPGEFTERLYSFPSSEMRKLWNLFNNENQ